MSAWSRLRDPIVSEGPLRISFPVQTPACWLTVQTGTVAAGEKSIYLACGWPGFSPQHPTVSPELL